MEKPKILVIDDEEEICNLTKSFLSKRNYSVFIAQEENGALEIAARERPALVLLDVRLGGVSGLEVLRKIKAIDKAIKVIMVTGLDDAESIRQAKDLGADDYITKPFTTAYLFELVSQKLSGKIPQETG